MTNIDCLINKQVVTCLNLHKLDNKTYFLLKELFFIQIYYKV